MNKTVVYHPIIVAKQSIVASSFCIFLGNGHDTECVLMQTTINKAFYGFRK